MNFSFSTFSWLSLVVSPKSESKNNYRTHDYTQSVEGQDYVFESLNGGIEGHMTGQGKDIKLRDYIILQHGLTNYCYQVEEIDYYLDPPDMWMALLKQVSPL